MKVTRGKRVRPLLARSTNKDVLIANLGVKGLRAILGHEHLNTTMRYYVQGPDKSRCQTRSRCQSRHVSSEFAQHQ